MGRTIITFLIVSTICVSLPLLVASAQPEDLQPKSQLWEYKTVSLLSQLAGKRRSLNIKRVHDYQDIEKSLNELGDKGWELCETSADLFIFKRAKSSDR